MPGCRPGFAVDHASRLRGDVVAAGLQYGVGPLAGARRSQPAVMAQSGLQVYGSEVGATYDAGDYSVGLSVGSTSTPHHNVVLPRVLPGLRREWMACPASTAAISSMRKAGWRSARRPASTWVPVSVAFICCRATCSVST